MVAETKKVAAKRWDKRLDFRYTDALRERKLKTSALAYLVSLEGEIKLDVVTFRMQGGAKYKNDLKCFRTHTEAPPAYSKGAMHDRSVIVLVGPQTNGNDVIRALRKLANVIYKEGTVAGVVAATTRR